MKLSTATNGLSILFSVALALFAFGVAAEANGPGPGQAGRPDADATIKNLTARTLVEQAKKTENARSALVLLTQAVRAAPNEPMIHFMLGRVLVQMNYSGVAERELRQARKGGVPDDLVLPPLLHAVLGQHHERQLLNEFPDPGANAKGSVAADILKARAEALAALGRTPEAISAMDHSLSLRRDVSGLLVRAQIATKQGNSAQAASLIDQALKLGPHDARAMEEKVKMLMDANSDAAALAINDQMIHDFPRDLAARVTRIELLQRLKQGDKAQAEMEAVIAMTKGSSVARYYQAVILAKKDKRAAWRIAQSLPLEFIKGRTVALQVSDMAIGAGFVETGASILAAAIVKSPDALDLRLRLSALRLNENSPELALSVLAPVRTSDDPRIMDLLSQAYLAAGRDTEGFAVLDRMEKANPNGVVGHLKRAHDARPTDGEITFHLVRALDASGDRNSARALLKSLLDSDINFEDLDAARKLAAAWHLTG